MVGDDSLIETLRVMVSIELFLHDSFYCKHPNFLSTFSKHKEKLSSSVNNLLAMSVSFESLDSGLTGEGLVRTEAISNCQNKKWASFLCILALASVTKRKIISLYPDCGELKFKLLFNQQVSPRDPLVPTYDDLYILFSYVGIITAGEVFKPNHFVPIIIKKAELKRKQPVLPKQITGSSGHAVPAKKSSSVPAKKSSSVISPISSFFSPVSTVESMSSASVSGENRSLVAPKSTLVARPGSDVACYRAKAATLSDNEILKLIQNVFKPDELFKFPKINGRSFLRKWFAEYLWLCYSPSLDGAFCLPCVLFGHRFPDKCGKVKKLFIEPMSHWPDANACFKRHIGLGSKAVSKSGLHESTANIFLQLVGQASGRIQPIEVMVNEHARQAITENRRKLVPIIDTIKLCGRLGLALRGHRDDSKYHPELGSYSMGGVGNFIELLNFRVRAGDTVLEEHLKTCPKNASYISKNTQNDLVKSCGQVITEKIINEVKRNKFFSIIADQASDSSNKEQLSLVLRFVDDNNNIREDFVRFLHCKWGVRGVDLKKLVLDELLQLNLSISDCRGQGYDGAGGVAGHVIGLSAQILHVNHKAIYTHCFSHRLNLTITNSCSVPLVRNAFSHIKEISYFFNLSAKRQMCLEKNILAHSPDSAKMKLRDVCRTRWIERVNGMDVFQELFVPIFLTFDEMSTNADKMFNAETTAKATSLLVLVSSFQFIAALVISRNVLDMTLPVTQLLQARTIDVMGGIHLIESLKHWGISARNQVDYYHDIWYTEAVALADKINVEEKMPRCASRQRHRDNPPSVSASDYFKKAITIPLLDHLNINLTSKFDFASVNAYYGLSIVPSKMISLLHSTSDRQSWKEKFKMFSNFYEDDLPNCLGLDGELELWQTYWETYKGSKPDTVASTLKSLNFAGFENIKIALRILATLPVTSCECERSFSALRRLKTYNRSTMVEDRLNGLALMHIHQEIEPDVEEVINKFSFGNRRLEMKL